MLAPAPPLFRVNLFKVHFPPAPHLLPPTPLPRPQVLYVDYGNSEVISKDRIAPLPAGCTDLPFQAVKFNLALLDPVPEDWTIETRACVAAARMAGSL